MKKQNMRCLAWLLILIVVVFAFAGCQEEKKELSQVDKAKNKVLQIGHQFLDYEITADEAYDQLDALLLPDSDSCFSALCLSIDTTSLKIKLRANRPSYSEIEECIANIERIDTSDSYEKESK